MNRNDQVTKYISEAPDEQRKIMEVIRSLIHVKVPSVEENFKWSRPVFSSKSGDFAYFKTAKSYTTFGIFEFGKIKDHKDLLEGTGKDMRHIKIKTADDIRSGIIEKWLEQITE